MELPQDLYDIIFSFCESAAKHGIHNELRHIRCIHFAIQNDRHAYKPFLRAFQIYKFMLSANLPFAKYC